MIQVLGCGVESRPLNILKRPDAQSGGSWWADAAFWEGLALGAVKQSGPSPGVGNSFTDGLALGAVKQSGPSPGVGNSFTYAANDGPSPGVGH
ncbi:unnamed protein product [Linum tenue]|uniref:Uncharacterized protein n=1 Tax=Linum tenue TaxID=586396 RepID=A0AAV0NS53_9ROSI|nr:unnamed protein product [Linum tenue]